MESNRVAGLAWEEARRINEAWPDSSPRAPSATRNSRRWRQLDSNRPPPSPTPATPTASRPGFRPNEARHFPLGPRVRIAVDREHAERASHHHELTQRCDQRSGSRDDHGLSHKHPPPHGLRYEVGSTVPNRSYGYGSDAEHDQQQLRERPEEHELLRADISRYSASFCPDAEKTATTLRSTTPAVSQ